MGWQPSGVPRGSPFPQRGTDLNSSTVSELSVRAHQPAVRAHENMGTDAPRPAW